MISPYISSETLIIGMVRALGGLRASELAFAARRTDAYRAAATGAPTIDTEAIVRFDAEAHRRELMRRSLFPAPVIALFPVAAE